MAIRPDHQRLFHDAVFRTGVPDRPRVGALLTRGEEIVAVGDREELRAHASGPVEEIGLDGAFVTAGWADAHLHTGAVAVGMTALDLRGVADLDEALARVRERVAGLEDEAWLIGGRWNANTWSDGRTGRPTRQALDTVTGTHPAALYSVDGHTLWVNTAALRLAGIDRTTPDPPGGHIVRDADGEATGLLQENAMDLVYRILPELAGAELDPVLDAAQDHFLAHGLTTVHCFDGEEVRESYLRLHEHGRLRVRVHKSVPMDALGTAIAQGRRTGDGDRRFSTGPVKLFADGALGSHTAFMTEPFVGTEDRGIEVIPHPELVSLVRTATEAGIAVATHAIGDAATASVLDAYAAVGAGHHGLRHRIEHTQHVVPADVARLAELGVIASMQPTHCITDADLIDRIVGDRPVASHAWRSLTDAGAVLALGSDAPVEPVDPRLGLHAAVTRTAPGNDATHAWQPEECLTVEEALTGLTLGPARAAGQDRHLGRLAPGYLADLTALASDPTALAPDELSALTEIPLVATVVGAEVEYRA